MFHADEDFSTGTQLVLRLNIGGWLLEGDEAIETGDENSEMILTAIVEVTRCLRLRDGRREVGVKFVGRIL